MLDEGRAWRATLSMERIRIEMLTHAKEEQREQRARTRALPVLVGSCHDRALPPRPNGQLRPRVLVVQQRGKAVPSSLLCSVPGMGPSNQKSMEKGGQRLRVEAPKGPGGASAMKGEGS